jgi:glutathione S-transferase
MIDLHYAPTPNGWKISIMLEELGLPYTVVPVNIRAGEQFKPEFLAISPNNRIPAIVDHAPADGGGPFSVFETGAILIFRGVPTGPREARPDDRLRREPGSILPVVVMDSGPAPSKSAVADLDIIFAELR